MRRVVVVMLAGVALGGACKNQPMASTAQCEQLMTRYIDLRLSEDPAARAMTDVDRAHLRGRIASDVLSEPRVKQVNERCQTEVTETEFQCAIKAPTVKAWNDCIQ